MIVQIYEISSATEAQEVAACGVDHIGVLVGDGRFPREIKIASAKTILAAIQALAKKVVLTLSDDLSAIENIATQLQPDIVHLGSLMEAITPGDVLELKKKIPSIQIMRSIPVIGERSIEFAKQYDGIADFLLLDSHKPDDIQIGATGLTHDWNVSKRIVESVKTPVILAGGLGPKNVADAIRRVHPFGVDSKTMTDRPGTHKKEIQLVKQFVTAAKL